MKKALLLSLCFSGFMSANLNAEEVVSLEEDININKELSETDSVEDHDIKFALEIGAKIDFWEPGMSKKDGQAVFKYDAEGLYLGYATLKTKIYDTDVFTLEKFSTLTSSDSQEELLSEYNYDKKQKSSVDGYKMSIHLMKILGYLFDSDFLSGLEYRYQTRNFIGEAELQYDALYWYGPHVVNLDVITHNKGSMVNFTTKFIEQKLLYTWDYTEDNSHYFQSFGVFDSKWSKPVYLGTINQYGIPIIFPANYEIQGLTASAGLKSESFGFDIYCDYGLNNKLEGVKGTSIEDSKDMELEMYTLGATMEYRVPDIYSSSYLNIDFILSGDVYSTTISLDDDKDNNFKIDEEMLYSIKTALEFTF